MSLVITIPKVLQDKLGPGGANALAETLNKFEESHRDHILELAEGKFEKRLAVEISRPREEIVNTRAELIKYMFIFWAGQIGVLTGILFAFFK